MIAMMCGCYFLYRYTVAIKSGYTVVESAVVEFAVVEFAACMDYQCNREIFADIFFDQLKMTETQKLGEHKNFLFYCTRYLWELNSHSN